MLEPWTTKRGEKRGRRTDNGARRRERTTEKGNKGGKIGEILFLYAGFGKTNPLSVSVYPSFMSISCFPRDDKRAKGLWRRGYR